MPAGAVAVILLVNGLQIALPQPAFVHEGRAWIPARAVLAAAGWQVSYDPERGMMLLTDGPGPSAQIHPDRPEAVVDGQAKTLTAAPRRLGDTLFLPADAFALLGMAPQWHPDTRAVHLHSPQSTIPAVSIRELKTAPFAFLERQVKVSGEYLGPHPLEPGAWMLRDRHDLVACRDAVSSGPTGLAREHMPLQYGARIEVSARVRMSRNASLYLDILDRNHNTGLAALTAIITTDRDSYRLGQIVLIEVQLANLSTVPIQLPRDRAARLTITDRTGLQLWSETLSLPQLLQPGQQTTLPCFFTPPPDLPPGDYMVDLEHDSAELWAAQWCFTQVSGPQQPKREREP